MHVTAVSEWYTDFKPLLFTIAHKMTGSISEAEDCVQDVFLRIHSNRQEFEDIRNPKAFLCKMVTNKCIDLLKSARKTKEVYTGTWLPEPVLYEEWNDPAGIVEREERISYAFLVFLEELNPVERAVFVLREALDMGFKEIEEITGKSTANCRQLYSRTRKKLDRKHADPQANRKESGAVVHRLIQAVAGNDLPALVRLLHADVAAYSDGGGKVLAALRPIVSRDHVIAFLTGLYAKEGSHLMRMSLRETDGGVAILLYQEEHIDTVILSEVAGDSIRNLYLLRNPDKLQRLTI